MDLFVVGPLFVLKDGELGNDFGFLFQIQSKRRNNHQNINITKVLEFWQVFKWQGWFQLPIGGQSIPDTYTAFFLLQMFLTALDCFRWVEHMQSLSQFDLFQLGSTEFEICLYE